MMDLFDNYTTDVSLGLGLLVIFFAAIALDRHLTVKFYQREMRK